MPAIGSQISRQDYNNLQRIVYNVWGPGGTNPTTNLPDPTYGYGQVLASSEIGSGDQTITEVQWDQLRTDINKTFTHQIGSVSTIPDVAGSASAGATNATRVTFGQAYQTYLAAANLILQNRSIFAASQFSAIPVNVATPKFTTTPWSVAVSQLVQVTFNSSAEARAFFNSGATINFRSQRTGGTSAPQNAAAQNNSWTSFLNAVGTVSFGKSEFYALTSGGLVQGAQPVFLYNAATPYSTNYYRIKANCNVASNSNGNATFITFLIEWIDSTVIPGIATDYIDGTLTSIISETKPIGVATVNSPTVYTIGELTPSGTAINLSPAFTFAASVSSVNEGGTVTFTFTSVNYPAGKSFRLEISGVTDSQLVGSTTGLKTISTTGNSSLASFTYPVTIRADATTNPGSILNARVTVASDEFQAGEILNAPVTINDTSVTPTPSVNITSTVANTIQSESIDAASASIVTLTNNGSRVLNISNISINRGSFLSEFSANFTSMSGAATFSATTIAVGQSKTFSVKFAGSTIGTQTAVVTVTSDGNDVIGGGPVPGTVKTANISVTVIAATFGITTSPVLAYTTSFASDGVTPGTTVPQAIRITNSTGNATVTLGTPAVTIAAAGNLTFNITGNPSGLTIAPGSFREFQVTFTGLTVPSTTSPTISIDCGTAGTKVITATVTGTQSLANISVSPSSLVATARVINVESTTTFNITNSGSAALVVSNITITGQNSYSTYTVSPTSFASIPVGATQTVTVTSKRSRIGENPGTITITSNALSPNNSKTLPFSMTSQSLTPYYIINTELFTGHPTNSDPVPLKRNSTLESFVTNAEPGATAYVYHQQASGIVSNVPVGTTPVQAFTAKLLPRDADGTGKLNFWNSGDRTEAWDVGISKLYAWIPVGKTDAGTQVWFDIPFKSGGDQGYVLMETFPNLTLSITPAAPLFPHTAYTANDAWPKVTWTVTGGVQNAPILLDPTTVRYDDQPQPAQIYTGSPTSLNAQGAASSSHFALEPGTWTVVMRQTYKGVVYRSNSVAVTPTSGPLFPNTTPYPGLAEPSATMYIQKVTWAPWVDSSLPSSPNSYHKWWRTISGLQPNGTYTLRGWADDLGAVVANYNFITATAPYQLNFNLTDGPNTMLVQANSQGGLRLIIVLFNGDNQQPTFAGNPGWVSVQLLSGNNVIWNLSQVTGAGY